MKIGLDIQATVGRHKTGLGIYTHSIAEKLKTIKHGHEIYFYSKEIPDHWNTLQRWQWENIELTGRTRKDRLDLLHVPAFAPPFFKPCRVIVTVHDLIGMLFPNQLGAASAFYWGRWLPFSAKRADILIADSENTKKDLIQHLGIRKKPIYVIYPSGHEGFEPKNDKTAIAKLKKYFDIREKYFLCVGTIEPRKNIGRVMQAFRHFLKSKKDVSYQLVVAGSQGFGHGKAFEALMSAADLCEGQVVFTDYVPNSDLNLLYSGAEAFLFPSSYEGFGIPVLEAMASGVPVLTSNTSSLPEAAGDAAYFVNPEKTHEILEGMTALGSDATLRANLIRRGFQQIQKFSWDKTAAQILEVYNSVV